jgi:hypothetical protein
MKTKRSFTYLEIKMADWLNMIAGAPRGGAPGQLPLGHERKKIDISEPAYYGEPVPEPEDPALKADNATRMAVISHMLGQPFPNDSLQDRMMPPRTYSPQPNGEIPDTRGWNSDQKYSYPMSENDNAAYMRGQIPGMDTLVGGLHGLANNADGTPEGIRIGRGIDNARSDSKQAAFKKNNPAVSGRRPRQ